MALIVNEIFHSLQGESTLTGLPFVFIRLTGCNLRCRYCDTTYAYEQGEPRRIDEILTCVASFPARRVTITGGEPLLQAQTPDLVRTLIDRGYLVSVETNGSMDIDLLDRRCIRVMDLKCPTSGMQGHNRMENIDTLTAGDQVKFVLADRTDFDFALSILPALLETLDPGNVLFSTVHDVLTPRQLALWMLDAGVEARLQIQLHKYLWPDKERGV